MGLGRRTSEGRVLCSNGVKRCVVMSERALHYYNSLWDWESGLQREGCCVVMGRSAVLSCVREFYFNTTPYGVGKVDLRGKGAV